MGTRELAVIPAAGGRTFIASIGQDGTGQLLDATDGQIAGRLTASPEAHFNHIALQAGTAPRMVTVDTRNHVAVWRPLDDRPEFTWQLPADVKVNDIAVANGDRPALLIAQADGHLAFFDVVSGQRVRASLACHATKFKVAVSSEQTGGSMRFATLNWSEPDQVSAWIISGDKVTRKNLQVAHDPDVGHSSGVSVLAFAFMDNHRIVVGGGGYSSLRLWDADEGALLAYTRLEQAHRMNLIDVNVGEVAGRPLVLCGGYTCSLGLWPLGSRDEHHLRVGSPLWITKSLPGDRAVVAGPRGIMAIQLSAQLPGRPPDSG
jgi:WD40 repeat protein